MHLSWGSFPFGTCGIGMASHVGDTILRLAGSSGFSPFRASHSAPIRPGLVSCRWRPWGCVLQSVGPPENPYPFRGLVPSCRCSLRSKGSCFRRTGSGIRYASGESRLQGVALFGKLYLQQGVWPCSGPLLSWTCTSPGSSLLVSWDRLRDPAPLEP